ncbi:MAG: NAD-dependent deacylase [Nitrosopumilus sp.]|nr:NAD-dependent deacylase [Nitrosopumilus sp.]MDA7942500.1 NAD-dependent deacylase [Nitrosopumilus sp.]MDA7958194.1 NAD-dependent deacylase [Nitrosopumilus sp.]
MTGPGPLAGARRITFVTGAGISRESGIPTFRGREGLWRNHDASKLATVAAFERDPGLVWEWYLERRRGALAAEPNAGHLAVAAAERAAEVRVVTQNIDGLHGRAGSSRVIELHGNITRTRCSSCSGDWEGDLPGMPPRCGCGGLLRPDVVWFGEALGAAEWGAAAEAASWCDAMVIAGTSLAVSPANTLPLAAKRAGATLVEVNTEETPMSYMMDASLRGTCSEELPRLVERL